MKEGGPPAIMAVVQRFSREDRQWLTASWTRKDHVMLYVGIDQSRKQLTVSVRGVCPKALAVAEFARIQTTRNRLNSGEFSYFRGLPGIIGTPRSGRVGERHPQKASRQRVEESPRVLR